MLYRMELTYEESEIVEILDVNNVVSTIGYTLPPGKNEITDISLMLKSLLPKQVKISFTIDDIRLKTNSTTNKAIRFPKKSFFYTISGSTQSHSVVLGDIEGFIQLIPGSCKSDRPIITMVIDKIHLKSDCINSSILNGLR